MKFNSCVDKSGVEGDYMKKISVMTFIILLSVLMNACSDKEEEQNEEVEETVNEEEAPVDIPEGVQLELNNVGEEARSVFEEYFPYIEQAHEDMIYRKTEATQEIFQEEREDLNRAKLIYDGETNYFDYVFFYDPKPNDLLMSSDQPIMFIDVSSYLYIQNTIKDYFYQVKSDLLEKGIHLDNNTNISFMFLKEDNSYVQMDIIGSEVLVTVENTGDPQQYMMTGTFASGPIIVSVEKPTASVQGENSDEAALLEFFDVPYEALTEQDESPIQEAEEEETSPPTDETAMDHEDEMKATNDLEYSLEEFDLTLQFPKSWQGKYAVTEGDWMEDASKTIDFTFMNHDKPVGNIFSLVMTDMEEQAFKDYYEDSFVEFIKEVDGKSIGYSIPGEPPTELFEDDNKALLDEMIRMVSEDLPQIIDNIKK